LVCRVCQVIQALTEHQADQAPHRTHHVFRNESSNHHHVYRVRKGLAACRDILDSQVILEMQALPDDLDWMVSQESQAKTVHQARLVQ
uniref:Saposin B-type domain-containing protein n=1 Tax=Anisakis simplex TaxID=6269 RepID=A0A0M3JMY5_ANISI